MGLANYSTIFADEPGSFENRGGTLMYHALRQSIGKRPGQRLIIVGTRAPAEPGNWWPQLLDAGNGPGIHVTELSPAREDPWDAWPTIRKVNPMVLHNATLRQAILRERDHARREPTLRRAFKAYRLNAGGVDTFNEVLLQVEAWERVEARKVMPACRPSGRGGLIWAGKGRGRRRGACGRTGGPSATPCVLGSRRSLSASGPTGCRRVCTRIYGPTAR